VSVVVVQVAGEFASDAGEADLEEAGKDGSPAFLEDGAVESFDVAVGLRSPGADAGVADIEGGERVGEAAAAELVAVIGFFLYIDAFFGVIAAWLAILFTGRYPRGIFDYVEGVIRWHNRVVGYAWILVTDRYPPFRLRP
jgi:hypothetical protein